MVGGQAIEKRDYSMALLCLMVGQGLNLRSAGRLWVEVGERSICLRTTVKAAFYVIYVFLG